MTLTEQDLARDLKKPTKSLPMSPILTAREITNIEDTYEMSWDEIMMSAWPPKPIIRLAKPEDGG